MSRKYKTKNDRKGKHITPEASELHSGVIYVVRKGDGYFTPDEGGDDVHIPKSSMQHAMDGDRVLVRYLPVTLNGRKAGAVSEITNRAVQNVAGTFITQGNFAFVIPDNRHISDVYVAEEDFGDARDGDKVNVKITKYTDESVGARGIVTEVFGRAGEAGTETVTVMSGYNVSDEFPESVLEETEKIPDSVSESSCAGRKDLRQRTFVTIDGADAKDFDDAVSADKLEDGSYVLYVSIADVSEYVPEGSATDREALRRGCSVYFPGKVCPMLPEKLSNGICSLKEGVDRLTLTAELAIASDGNVTDCKIYESVIHSRARLIYDDVSDILERDDEKLKVKYAHLVPMLSCMRELAEILGKKRFSEGSVNFNIKESEIIIGSDGEVESVRPAGRRVANRMIEEFMLAANRAVAEHIFWMQIPFVYRTHDKPDRERMEQLKRFAGGLGLGLKGSCDNISPGALNDLLKKAEEKDCGVVISGIALRSMKKAEYSTNCSGHFGLNFRYYCHFTSPIRRYPDLFVHRVIRESLRGGIGGKRHDRLEALAYEAAVTSTSQEKNALEAERGVEKRLKASYMSRFEGEVFDGVINSIINSGFFVELENTIDGFVSARNLTDDYYYYDEENYRLIGESSRRVFRIGQNVKIKVDRVDLTHAEIDFVLVEKNRKRH